MEKIDQGWTDCRVGGVHWQVVSGCQDQLLGPAGLRLDEWLRAGQARIVKHGPHRTVYHVSLPNLIFYLKHYRLADFRAKLRQLIRPSKARMECICARSIAARQVPTITPLALGECVWSKGLVESFLITLGLHGCQPLDTYIESVMPNIAGARQSVIRQRLARELGRFVARMHDAGIRHTDLHAGNILVTFDSEDRPAFYLIDLHAVRLGRPLNWTASRDNLVIFTRWFITRASRADRLRFWRAYYEARAKRVGKEASAPYSLLQKLARDLEQRTLHSLLGFWRRRDRRCLASNRYYRRVKGNGLFGHAVTELDDADLAALVANPEEPFARPGIKVLKNSRSSAVVEFEVQVNGRMTSVIYKHFRTVGWADFCTSPFRLSQAVRSWVFGHGMRERGLPTARPLAILYRRRFGLKGEAYLLQEKITNAVDLRKFVEGLTEKPGTDAQAVRRQAIDKLARLVRELHRRGLEHRDLKAVNVLVSGQASMEMLSGCGEHHVSCSSVNTYPEVHIPPFVHSAPSPFTISPNLASVPTFWLIDLGGVSRHRRVPRSRRVQNLARLNASFWHQPGLTQTDKLRFLRVYLQWGLNGRDGWKDWWRQIEQATRTKVARNTCRGRVLA